MPAVGDFLRRFRFHGVPGAPRPGGVPVDRTREFEAELDPVFSLLEDTQRAAGSLVEEAMADAALRRARAAEHARSIVARAASDAEVARSESISERLARAGDQRSAMLARAGEEARRIDRVSAERAPPLVEEIVRRVLSMGQR